MKKLLLMLLLISLSLNASADWAIFGVASKCDTTVNSFELSSVVELSSEDIAAIPVKNEFRQLAKGKNEISCKLKSGLISGSIDVFKPDNGNCMGAGYVYINSLTLNNSISVVNTQAFNWFCISKEPMLVNVKVYLLEEKLVVEKCTANGWEWGKGFENVKCEKPKTLQ